MIETRVNHKTSIHSFDEFLNFIASILVLFKAGAIYNW